MNTLSNWEQQLVGRYLERSLDETFPELRQYLSPGASVLDVGCGPGSITLGVAEAVSPGKVVGVEPAGGRVSIGTVSAEKRNIRNVTFVEGDAHRLDFPDDSFDVVYSHTVLHCLIDPVGALREQMRVVKSGGWVIAAGVHDWGFTPRYPACPTLDKVFEAHVRYHENLQKRYQSGERVSGSEERKVTDIHFLDLYAGRKCKELFETAGLTDVDVRLEAEMIESTVADPVRVSTMFLLPPPGETDDPLADVYRDIYAEGYLDESTVDQAREEVIAWSNHPYAFIGPMMMFAAGKA